MPNAAYLIGIAVVVFGAFYVLRVVIGWMWTQDEAKKKFVSLYSGIGGLFFVVAFYGLIIRGSSEGFFVFIFIGFVIWGLGLAAEYSVTVRAIRREQKKAEQLRSAEALRQQEEEERERQRREADRRKADEQRAQVEAEKVKLRAKRDEVAGQQALNAHMAVIVGAVRALRQGGENVVLLNTIDGEVKSIGRDEKITKEMLIDGEIREEISLVLNRLEELEIHDKILSNRIRRTFRLDGLEGSGR
jgi:hypothetical protein